MAVSKLLPLAPPPKRSARGPRKPKTESTPDIFTIRDPQYDPPAFLDEFNLLVRQCCSPLFIKFSKSIRAKLRPALSHLPPTIRKKLIRDACGVAHDYLSGLEFNVAHTHGPTLRTMANEMGKLQKDLRKITTTMTGLPIATNFFIAQVFSQALDAGETKDAALDRAILNLRGNAASKPPSMIAPLIEVTEEVAVVIAEVRKLILAYLSDVAALPEAMAAERKQAKSRAGASRATLYNVRTAIYFLNIAWIKHTGKPGTRSNDPYTNMRRDTDFTKFVESFMSVVRPTGNAAKAPYDFQIREVNEGKFSPARIMEKIDGSGSISTIIPD